MTDREFALKIWYLYNCCLIALSPCAFCQCMNILTKSFQNWLIIICNIKCLSLLRMNRLIHLILTLSLFMPFVVRKKSTRLKLIPRPLFEFVWCLVALKVPFYIFKYYITVALFVPSGGCKMSPNNNLINDSIDRTLLQNRRSFQQFVILYKNKY